MIAERNLQLRGGRWAPKLGLPLALLGLVTAAALLYRHHAVLSGERVQELVSALPGDAATVIYVDALALRQSPFFKGLLGLAPAQQVDADYADFLRATGFHYERDLDRAAIAFRRDAARKSFFAIVEGRFDQGKIIAFATSEGSRTVSDGRDIYSTPMNHSSRRISFAFLSSTRLALTDDVDLAASLKPNENEAAKELRERAVRLAGSPIFAILRQGAPGPLAQRPPAPGGVRFNQLSSVLANLRWVTLAARPDGERLRLVAEGECASDDAARRIAESVEGMLTVARLGIDDPKARKAMDPAMHEALVDALKSADVSRIDRDETKAVRLVVDFGPKILDALQSHGE